MRPVLWLVWLFLRFVALFRPHLLIAPGGVAYLDRWYLTPTRKSRFAKWWRRHMPGVFLHCFVASDPDRVWHSHPWHWARSLILRGEYRESRPMGLTFPNGGVSLYDEWRHFGPGDWNTLDGETFHKVKLVTPRVWTLFIVGPLHGREWEFMNEAGKTWPHGTETPGD